MVGPRVNRPPTCGTYPHLGRPYEVLLRPGASRRFAIACEDADHDPMTISIEDAPRGGELTTQPGFTLDWYPGMSQELDALYEPFASQPERDPFLARVRDAAGADVELPYELVIRDRSLNEGLGCSGPATSHGAGYADRPLDDLRDHEGDPITVDVAGSPRTVRRGGHQDPEAQR